MFLPLTKLVLALFGLRFCWFFRTSYAKLLVTTLTKLIQMKKQLTQILDLPGVVVKSQKNLENALVLEIESQSKTATCPTCQQT